MVASDFNVFNELHRMRGRNREHTDGHYDYDEPQDEPEPKPDNTQGASEASEAPADDQHRTHDDSVSQSSEALSETSQTTSESYYNRQTLGTEDINAVLDMRHVNWRGFQMLDGIFHYTGGERPVGLAPDIKLSQVSRVPDSLLTGLQEHLKSLYMNARVSFPWGVYEIKASNCVFRMKSSLIRYLLFDGFRDEHGTHLQYAKQWLLLHHKAHTETFDPSENMNPNDDKLDIYALMAAAYEDAGGTPPSQPDTPQPPALDGKTQDQIGMLDLNMKRVLDKLKQQEKTLDDLSERSMMLQTILLLDRFGLLKGGLPKDVASLARVLEDNRGSVQDAAQTIDAHMQAEDARRERMRTRS